MSINFDDPMNDEVRERMHELFGKPIGEDEKTALFDALKINRQQMTTLANIAKQPITAEINEIGDIKILSDGSKYEVTEKGWEKIPLLDYEDVIGVIEDLIGVFSRVEENECSEDVYGYIDDALIDLTTCKSMVNLWQKENQQ